MSTNISIESAFGYYQAGDLQKAEEVYREILAQEPDNVDALHFLGILCYQKKNYDSAISYIKQALQINPGLEDAHYNLGIVLQDSGQLDEAIAQYQKAVEINPNVAEIYYNLGFALQKKGNLDDAVIYYQKALQINRDFEDAYYNLGVIFQQKGLSDEAVTYYQRALLINPDLADVNNNLGLISQQRGKLDEAISYYILALETNPNLANAYSNLGNAFQEKGQPEQAIASFQKALDLNPNLFHVFYNLGNAYKEEGQMDKAITAYEKALEINPDFSKARWAQCMAHLPVIYQDEAGIMSSRRKYQEELIKLNERISLAAPQDINAAAETVGSHQPFYLAAQGLNDRELQKIYGGLVGRIMAAKYPQWAEILAMPPPSPSPSPSRGEGNIVTPPLRGGDNGEGETIRIGIVSGHFHHHSIWKIPVRGWIENLDRNKFNLYGYYTGSIKDHVTSYAQQNCTRFVQDIRDFEKLCQAIREDNLHVIIYPETGMDPVTLKLAALRLAPVQCATLGHPDTTGLETIDYYLSSELMEPPDADTHYTERLIRLSNLSFSYFPPDIQPAALNRDTYGLRKDSVLYLCSHAVFTHLPQYDKIYARIAQQVSNSQFIFIEHYTDYVTSQFSIRLYEAFRRFNLNPEEHIVFLKEFNQETYLGMNCLSDVFLDTPGWSGNNSTFEAISCNLPVVTLPGAFMRQRHCSGILKMMDVTETIVDTINEYVALAVRLGQDSDYRRQISEKIAANRHRIYKDRTCIKSLEDFLEKAVKRGQAF